MSTLNIFLGGTENLSYGMKKADYDEEILKIETSKGIEYKGNYIYKPMKALETLHPNLIAKFTSLYLLERYKDNNLPYHWNANENHVTTPIWIPITGPGCISPQADDTLYKKLNWTDAQLFQNWENNIAQAIDIIKLKKAAPLETIKYTTFLELLEAKIPGGWTLRNYNIDYDSYFHKTYNLPTEMLYPEPIISCKPSLEENAETPTQINLIGWSRGAVSCHMLANAMLNDSELKHIPVNIFAIDPICTYPSPSANQTKPGNNVKEYVGFYARDERSPEYTAVVPDTDNTTKIHIYPLAGDHWVSGGFNEADGLLAQNPRLVVRNCMLACLSRWGSNFGLMDPKATVEDTLTKIKSDYDQYLYMRTAGTGSSAVREHHRQIMMGNTMKDFTSAQGDRFTPKLGLASGHAQNIDFYNDIL